MHSHFEGIASRPVKRKITGLEGVSSQVASSNSSDEQTARLLGEVYAYILSEEWGKPKEN